MILTFPLLLSFQQWHSDHTDHPGLCCGGWNSMTFFFSRGKALVALRHGRLDGTRGMDGTVLWWGESFGNPVRSLDRCQSILYAQQGADSHNVARVFCFPPSPLCSASVLFRPFTSSLVRAIASQPQLPQSVTSICPCPQFIPEGFESGPVFGPALVLRLRRCQFAGYMPPL